MSLPTNPLNRKEAYLNAIATGNTADMPAKPITREEAYLDAIAKNGGGSGGAENYAQLSGKPQINNVELESGNNSLSALGIASESAVNGIKDGQSINSFSAVETALAGKVDKVEGKGLSTNDYSDTEKGKVADNASAIEAIVNEYGAKNLLPNNAKSQTVADGTITVNSDGSIRTNIATTNGVAYDITDYFTIPIGDYIFSKGMSQEQSQIWVQFFNGSTFVKDIKLEGEASKLVTIDYDGYTQLKCVGYIPPLTTIDTTVYPMLRDARITDPTYVPYAMTNKQLTEKIDRGSVSVTADGVKTIGALFDELMAMVDKTKLSESSYVMLDKDCFRWQYTGITLNIPFTEIFVDTGMLCVYTLRYTTGGSAWLEYTSVNGVQDKTATVITAGTILSLHY